MEKLEKQGSGEQLSMAASVPPLPSLAELPEEGDKELDLEPERESRFQKSSRSMSEMLYQKKENGYKLFQVSPGDERKAGDVLHPLWILLEISLVFVSISGSF